MLDIKLFRENPAIIRKSEIKRGHGTKFLDAVIKCDNEWRKALKKVEELKAKRNAVTKEISQLKKQGKKADSKIKSMKKVATDIQKQDSKVKEVLLERDAARMAVGNILEAEIPKGKDDSENVPIKHVGKKPKFDFPHKDHIEIGEELDLFDFDMGAKVAGSRFVYFKNEAVLLDLAIQNYAISILVKHGFNMVWPPLMLNRAALAGGVNLSEFEDTIYKIENEDLYLIATSELPLVALKKDQVIPEEELPFRFGGISTCFRKELGAHGRDDKGTIRMHQFNKVEEVVYCKPKDSPKYFKEMQAVTEEMWKELGIPFRVVVICTGDIGNKQALQYDIEAWFPGQDNKKGLYREVTSCSNCKDYQAVTLNTKYLNKKTGEKEYVHMLNNTAIATSRAIPAILENFQQKDGSIKIPKCLWKYTGFKTIKPKKK
jgi:seryl-tRNA synthetase